MKRRLIVSLILIFLISGSTNIDYSRAANQLELEMKYYFTSDDGKIVYPKDHPENCTPSIPITYEICPQYSGIVFDLKNKMDDSIEVVNITIWQEITWSNCTWIWTGPKKINDENFILPNSSNYEFTIDGLSLDFCLNTQVKACIWYLLDSNTYEITLNAYNNPNFTQIESWNQNTHSTNTLFPFLLFPLILFLNIIRKYRKNNEKK